MGVNVGAFIAGGLLQGTGTAIQKQAEDARASAIQAFKLSTELQIADAANRTHIQGAEIGAGAQITAATIHEGGEGDRSAAKIKSEEKIAGGHDATTIAAANIKEIAEDKRANSKVELKPNEKTGTYWAFSKDGKSTFDTGVGVGTQDKNPQLVNLQDGTLARVTQDAKGNAITTPITDAKTGQPVKGTKVGDIGAMLAQMVATGQPPAADTPAPAAAPGIMPPPASATPAPAAAAPAALSPGTVKYIKGQPYHVSPDGKSFLPGMPTAPAAPQVPTGP